MAEATSARPTRPRRSVLYLPASNLRAIDKARSLPADSIVFDLEDAVAPAAKPQARDNLRAAFAQGGFGSRELVIRSNAISSADLAADLATVAACQPHAVLLPKVSSTAEIALFADAARQAGMAPGTATWFMAETLAGIQHLPALLAAGAALPNRLACLVVGTNDIAKESGVSVQPDRLYLLPWLMQMVLAAKLAGVPVLDGVWNDFKDSVGFEREALQAQQMGFAGKTLIHPSQIDAANRQFSPDPAALAQAQRIVNAFALHHHADAGVINLDGEMVERLHLAQAQQLLAVAQQISALGD